MVDRRSCLKLLGSGALALGVAGSASAASNVVYLDEEGLSEGDTIDPYLADYWQSDYEVHVPAGTYHWNGENLGGTKNDAALIGDGDVTFQMDDGEDLQNTVSVSAGSTLIENITVKGKAGSGKNRIAWQCTDSSASLTVENFNLPDGSYGFGEHPSPIGMFVRDANVGTVHIKDCHIEGWANNGIYSTHSPGATIVECCHVVDCDIDHVRLGDNDEIRDSFIEMRNSQAGRGVRIRYDGNMVIDGLHVINDAGEDPMVCARNNSAHCDISNVFIENNTGNDAIRVETGAIDVESNVNVTGSGSYSTTGNIVDESLIEKGSSATSPETSMSDICSGSGGGGGTQEVAEDFSHDDIPGTYGLDTGAFTTSSTRSTSDSYSLLVDDDSDDPQIVLRDDMVTSAGNTYTLDVYHQSGSDADMGFLFGAQGGATGWSDYTGYMGFFNSNTDEIELLRKNGGSTAASSVTAATWPLDEWLTVELDYRNTDSSTIAVTVLDAAGAEVASLSLGDTTHDSGTVGWYNYHATSDWHADSWFALDSNSYPVETHKYSFDESWVSTSHSSSVSSPVTIAKPISDDGGSPAHTRLQNVTSDSFSSKVEEWTYLDEVHTTETVSSLTTSAGAGTTDDGTPTEAGTVTVTDTMSWSSVSFSQSFATTPVVLTQSQTYNGGAPIVTRNRSVSTGGFDTTVQEEDSSGHLDETIGYFAVEPGTGTLGGKAFEAGTASVDDTWTTISFSQSYTDPIFVADMQTTNGSNTCNLRYQNLGSGSVEVFIEEEQASDTETDHTTETVGFVVVEGA